MLQTDDHLSTRISLPKRIILLRHCEAEKNINAIINGNGKLTISGKTQTLSKVHYILNYLNEYGYDGTTIDVCACSEHKQQVKDTIEIIKKHGIASDRIRDNISSLRPTYMGILSGVSEWDASEKYKDALHTFHRWHNKEICLEEYHIQGMELPEEFWARAKEFFNTITGCDCVIVVCTTSIATLLIYYLINNRLNKKTYWHIDIPLGGIVHFVLNNDDKYYIVNKNDKMNIRFSSMGSDVLWQQFHN